MPTRRSRRAPLRFGATHTPPTPPPPLTSHRSAQEDEADPPAAAAPGEPAGVADAAAAEAAAAGLAFRVRTLTVPVSVADAAPSPWRLHELLGPLAGGAEGGAPVSLALVDTDGTVIVSHLYAGLVPPETLEECKLDAGELVAPPDGA